MTIPSLVMKTITYAIDFSKNSAVIAYRLLSINLFLEETCMKAGTNVKFNNNVHQFPVSTTI